jgi:hypothetical protein
MRKIFNKTHQTSVWVFITVWFRSVSVLFRTETVYRLLQPCIKLSQNMVAYPRSGKHGRRATDGSGAKWIWRNRTYIFCADEYFGSLTSKFRTEELGNDWVLEWDLGNVLCLPYFKTNSRQV